MTAIVSKLGPDLPRHDGVAKVTGAARYAADQPTGQPLWAWLVTSSVATGRITAIDRRAAERIPGVRLIWAHDNAPKIADLPFFGAGGPAVSAFRPMTTPEIRHAGQMVALVVAETKEAAREAAYAVVISCAEGRRPAASFGDEGTETVAYAEVIPQHEELVHGDVEAALAGAAHRIEAEYETPTQHHNPIELYTTMASWDGDELTLHEASQWVYGLSRAVAKPLGMPAEKVRVVCPYVGGAFGAKATVIDWTAHVAQEARALGRPVKLVVTRQQGFTVPSYRAETRHRVRMGADAEGRLVAYDHAGEEITSRTDAFGVAGTDKTHNLYNIPAIRTDVRLVRADRNTPGFMRSPAEVPYCYAQELALDELAWAAGIDPIAFRIRNDVTTDVVTGARWSSRALPDCFRQASEAFGWDRYEQRVGAVTEGDWLVGWGAAATWYPTQYSPAAVRVRLAADGTARAEVAVHEVGTGAYTAVAALVADGLGLKPEAVSVELGRSTLPPGPVAGGSVTTASVRLAEGRLGGAPLAAVMEAAGLAGIEESGEWTPEGVPPKDIRSLYDGGIRIVPAPKGKRITYAMGAVLSEVRIHRLTREIRVTRLVGAMAGGRIVSGRTARSQYLGGLVWGIGCALHEATELDRRSGCYTNANIAEYLVPLDADIRGIEVIMVENPDDATPGGVKGIGELANVGVPAAIAAALYHATGIRVRKLPIRIEDLLVRA